jgi:RimJ/RimL family protein N-acetyltransferase
MEMVTEVGAGAHINAILSPAGKPEDVLFETKEWSARPLMLTPTRLAVLWDKMRRFPILFASPEQTTFTKFKSILESDEVILIGIHKVGAEQGEPLGIIMIHDIEPGIVAWFQLSFFDQKLKGRESFIRVMVAWMFKTLYVRSVGSKVRADARSMRAFLERVGLYFAGLLKDRIRKGKKYYDLYLMEVCDFECDEHWLAGRSWAKPRVRRLEAYETR